MIRTGANVVQAFDPAAAGMVEQVTPIPGCGYLMGRRMVLWFRMEILG